MCHPESQVVVLASGSPQSHAFRSIPLVQNKGSHWCRPSLHALGEDGIGQQRVLAAQNLGQDNPRSCGMWCWHVLHRGAPPPHSAKGPCGLHMRQRLFRLAHHLQRLCMLLVRYCTAWHCTTTLWCIMKTPHVVLPLAVPSGCSGSPTFANVDVTGCDGSTCAATCASGYTGSPTISCVNNAYSLSGSCTAGRCCYTA